MKKFLSKILDSTISKAKTLSSKSILGGLIRMLPVIVCALGIIVYLFVPNRVVPPTPFVVIEFGNTLVWVAGIVAALLLVLNIIAVFVPIVRQRLQKSAPFMVLILILFVIYDIMVLKIAILPQPFFPWIDSILAAIIRDASLLITSMGYSLGILLAGYGIGGLLGIVAGVSAGLMPKTRYWVRPFVRFFSAVPIITWVPVIVFFPIGFFARAMLLIALAVWVPVTIFTMNGVMAIPSKTFEAARTFGTKGMGMIYKVAIPAASPSIFNGLASGMGVACTALIVAEMMGVPAGIGWYIDMQRGFLDYAAMYGAIIMLSLTFFAVGFVLSTVRKFVIRWKGAE